MVPSAAMAIAVLAKTNAASGVTLSVYTHLFEDAYDSVMDRLDSRPPCPGAAKSGPNVVKLSERKPAQAFDRGV